MKHVLIIAVLIGFTVTLVAQDTGAVVFLQDHKVDSLVAFYDNDRKQNSALVPGFRIQIISATNRTAIYKVKSDFYTRFPNERPDIVYQQPYFKLRVGSFRSKLEAYDMLMSIRKEFPDAFIIRDKIKPEDLNP